MNISTSVYSTTLRHISVKACITKLEHTLCHLGEEMEKLDCTDLPETAGGVHGGAAVGPARCCEG